MKRLNILAALVLVAVTAIFGALHFSPSAAAQGGATVNPGLYSGMRWRSVGPAAGVTLALVRRLRILVLNAFGLVRLARHRV